MFQSNNQAANSPAHPSIHPVAPLPTRDQSINQRPTNPSTHPSTKSINQSITWKLSRGTVRRLTNKLPVLADRLFRRIIPTAYQYQKHTRTHSFFKVSATRPLQTRNTNHPRHSYNNCFHIIHASLTTSYCLSLPSTSKTSSQTTRILSALRGYFCYLRRPRGRNEIRRAFKTPDPTGRKERFLPYSWNQLPATIDCFSIYYAGDPSVATLSQEGVFSSLLPGPCRNTGTRTAR